MENLRTGSSTGLGGKEKGSRISILVKIDIPF